MNRLYAFKEGVDVLKLISGLNDELLAVFNLRWLSCKSWEEVTYQLDLKPRQMKARRIAILNMFADVMGM